MPLNAKEKDMLYSALNELTRSAGDNHLWDKDRELWKATLALQIKIYNAKSVILVME